MNRQFEICIDLNCNVSDAADLLHEIVRTLASYNHLTKVSNLVMRGNDYTTLFTMYPNDKLLEQLEKHRNPPPAEPEDYKESEVDA